MEKIINTPMGNGIVLVETKKTVDVKHTDGVFKGCIREYKTKDMQQLNGWIAIEKVKKGDFFKKKPDAKKVWVKGDYNRFSKKYESADFDDCLQNFCQLKKGTLVFIDFEF